ncbi:hypothetical protein [Nostoc sp. NMS8]|uniref:hypothetical protein n=1 Tax=Nostoc sp. NMS8 TaxID=2815392 RepID=UPI0025EDA5A6|nr:hypothetical protein [Nostoc sp. NMS8]MBN3957463.1 hypothetical protein [Nostoc sp. NMS8]
MEDTAQSLDILINELQHKISTTNTALDVEVQKELAKILNVAQKTKSLLASAKLKNNKIKQSQIESLLPNVVTAIYALQGEPNKVLAKDLRRDAEIFVRQLENPFTALFINGFHNFLYLTETPSKVIIGLLVALPVHLAAPIILAHLLSGANLYLKPILTGQNPTQPSGQSTEIAQKPNENSKNRLTQYDFDESSALLLLCAMSGATGSVVSILTRIEEYRNQKYQDSLLPVFVGAFKPMIGGFFGILIFALFNSTLLPISITKDETKPTTKWFGFMALAFVVGFSERFAKDIVSQTEKIVPGDISSKNANISANSTGQLPVADEPTQENQTPKE